MAKKRLQPHSIHLPARVSATVGYFLLFVSWLLVIGIVGISVIEAVGKFLNPYVTPDGTGVLSLLNTNLTSQTSKSIELAVGVKLLLILVLIVLGTLISHFVAVHMSQLFRQLIAAIGLKLTSGHLFVMKCLLALVAPLLMMVAILGLPDLAMSMADLIVALCGTLAVISVICFSIQHFIARKAKMNVKQIL